MWKLKNDSKRMANSTERNGDRELGQSAMFYGSRGILVVVYFLSTCSFVPKRMEWNKRLWWHELKAIKKEGGIPGAFPNWFRGQSHDKNQCPRTTEYRSKRRKGTRKRFWPIFTTESCVWSLLRVLDSPEHRPPKTNYNLNWYTNWEIARESGMRSK